MKKILLIAMALVLAPVVSQAQLGGYLQRAAKKAAEKTVEKTVDKATDRATEKAEKAVDSQLDKLFGKDTKQDSKAADKDEMPTYRDIMKQMPELPTATQLVNHKEAELNDKALKLMASPVTSFATQVYTLSAQCLAVAYSDMDSATITDATYRYAESATGLTRQEIEAMEDMSDEEQEAYLRMHYSAGRAEAATVKHAEDVSKWLEPLQPLVDKWSAAGEKADEAYNEMDSRCRQVYAKYAARLAKAEGTERNSVLLSYYTEVVPYIRTAVQKAMKMRLEEQLPIAEEIEDKMVVIRKAHPDALAELMNYPQLTATQYFSETARLLEIPEYGEE